MISCIWSFVFSIGFTLPCIYCIMYSSLLLPSLASHYTSSVSVCWSGWSGDFCFWMSEEKPECDGGEYKTQRPWSSDTTTHEPSNIVRHDRQPPWNPQLYSVFSCLWIRDFKVLIKCGGETKGLSLYRSFWREMWSNEPTLATSESSDKTSKPHFHDFLSPQPFQIHKFTPLY